MRSCTLILSSTAVVRSWLGTDEPDATPLLHLPQSWEGAYLSCLTSRIGRHVKYNVSIRLDMFRGLVNSVRARGSSGAHIRLRSITTFNSSMARIA